MAGWDENGVRALQRWWEGVEYKAWTAMKTVAIRINSKQPCRGAHFPRCASKKYYNTPRTKPRSFPNKDRKTLACSVNTRGATGVP